MMTHLSLFSGIGGLDLAAEWAGFATVGQCEWADYPTRVLERHWPDVPRWRDIRTLTGEDFYDKTGLRTVDVISGGFPCQPFSVAGKQKGKGDDRYLWPEMLRVIRELAPGWVIGENVPGILRIAAADVVQDLEREGYNIAVFDFEATAVGAPHRRERVFFVAYSGGEGLQGEQQHGTPDKGEREQEPLGSVSKCGEDVPDTIIRKCGRIDGGGQKVRSEKCGTGDVPDPDNRGRTLRGNRELPTTASLEGKGRYNGGGTAADVTGEWVPAEPGLGGMADGFPGWVDENGVIYWLDEPLDVLRVIKGIPHRADRLKCLGNAVVPQQAYPIFKAIAEEVRRERNAGD